MKCLSFLLLKTYLSVCVQVCKQKTRREHSCRVGEFLLLRVNLKLTQNDRTTKQNRSYFLLQFRHGCQTPPLSRLS